MTDSMKTDTRLDGSFNAQFEAEQSSVRSRTDDVTQVSRGERPAPVERVGERNARIAEKIRRAERLLPRLGANDPRLRILCSAILRKDEVLLDAVLRVPRPSR